jgi:hypothetical protein
VLGSLDRKGIAMSTSTPTSEFQSHFGNAPGLPDAAAECKKWESLCAELIAEREKLREELDRSQEQCELYRKSLLYQFAKDYQPTFTKEEALAHADGRPTLQELISELDEQYAREP